MLKFPIDEYISNRMAAVGCRFELYCGSKAATQYCGLGCRSLSSSGLKAGANTPLNSYGASGGADLGFAAWKDVDMPDGNH